MKEEVYELVTAHEKLQALEDASIILNAWDGFGNVTRAIGYETKKLESKIEQLQNELKKE